MNKERLLDALMSEILAAISALITMVATPNRISVSAIK